MFTSLDLQVAKFDASTGALAAGYISSPGKHWELRLMSGRMHVLGVHGCAAC